MEGLHSQALNIIINILGWTYFLAWSLSFYPQVYDNWKRKSVMGLHFDFLNLNFLGYVSYSIYNTTLFFDAQVQAEFLWKFGPPIPVLPSDVFFALHGLCLTAVTIVQCFVYERGDQKVSIPAMIFTGLGYTSEYSILIASLTGTI